MIKTRYLQISDVMFFEMKMLGDGDSCDMTQPSSFILTKLKDGHKLILSPISYECCTDIDTSTGKMYYKKMKEPMSLSNLNHLAVPKDKNDSTWYTFLDPDYEFVDNSIMNQIKYDQIKAREYGKYMLNPFSDNGAPLEDYYSTIDGVRWDTARMYFVNGYDFSNIYGLMMRVYAESNYTVDDEPVYVDLCDFFFTKANAYQLIQYLPSPIIFGNNIYDRYIEVNVPCIYDLITRNIEEKDNRPNFFSNVNLKKSSTLKVSFAYVLDEDMEVSKIDYTVNEIINLPNITNDYVNCTFTRSSVLNGTIPVGELNSDYLGAYIAEYSDAPYLIFYATWKDEPLTKGIVWQFNKGIRLYDISLINRQYDDEVDDDYDVEHSMKKWMCLHEIKCSFCMDDQVVKEETYSMTQIFISDADPYMFYYRPVIFDTELGLYVNNVQIVYTIRFLNVNDKVQFVKIATLSLHGNLSKFYLKTTSLKRAQLTPYKVYNKVIEQKHEHVGGGTNNVKTKYLKIFYNSTEVVLDEDGQTVGGDYNYTLTLSQAPKSYKFTFKKTTTNGNYEYLDLSNGYYKLLFKDAEKNDNLIEPTYSTNMNPYVGEIEFNLNTSALNKLFDVEKGDRKMAIVSYGEDGTVSSMFDFLYTF